MNETSKNHEGKIHLGFVYSKDETFATAEKMLIDALNFSNTIEFLLDQKLDWDKIKSKKFLYLVSQTSLLKEENLDHFFIKIQQTYESLLTQNTHLNYLGMRPEILFKKIEIPKDLNRENFQCCYETEEYAINQHILNREIIKTIQSKNIPIYYENTIEKVVDKFKYGEVHTDKEVFYGSKIINCLWDKKANIDNSVFDNKCKDMNYRFKFGIVSQPIQNLENVNSITFVNGPFGDFVNFKNDYMYFSWYPYSLKGFCCSDKPPIEWNINSLIPEPDIFLSDHKKIFNDIFNRTFDFINPEIIGSIIVAIGSTDISDQNSKLHERNEKRIEYTDNYISISTGKYTSAPYNAILLSQMFSPQNQ